MKLSPHYSVFIFLKHNLNPCLSCRWRMTGSMWPWSSTGFSCGFSWRCACWEHWDSSSSRSSASWNETLPFLFRLFNLLFFCLLLSDALLELSWVGPSCSSDTSDTGLLLASKAYCLLSLPLLIFLRDSVIRHRFAPSAVSSLTWLTPICPLRLALSLCTQSSLLLPNTLFSFMTWSSHLLSFPLPSSIFLLSRALFLTPYFTLYSLSPHIFFPSVSHCVHSSLNFHVVFLIKNVHSAVDIVQSNTVLKHSQDIIITIEEPLKTQIT